MCRVIIADDEYLEREVLKKIIQSTNNAKVVGECNNGKSALELFSAIPCEVIFLNLKMGGMDGLLAARQIRDISGSVNIIITTGHAAEDIQKELSTLNIQEFILKPTPPKLIENIIKKYSANKFQNYISKPAKSKIKYYPSHLMSDHVSNVLNYIEEQYQGNITLDSVAKKVHLNRHYISRLFKKEVGITMSSYIISRKLEEAKILLSQTEKPISDISASLGFAGQSYFCKVFKKNLNQTPMEFRTQSRYIKNERKEILEKYKWQEHFSR